MLQTCQLSKRIVLYYLASLALIWLPTSVLADSLQITASVPATPDQFQLDMTGPANQATFAQDTLLTYHITFGSYLSAPTDMVAIEISWSLGTVLDTQQSLPVLEYQSATSAFGTVIPQIDSTNRKVTWTISPMPPGTDNQVTLTLRISAAYIGTSPVAFVVNSRLIGPGVNKIGPSVLANYQYQPPAPSPTATEASPSATPIGPTNQPTVQPTTPPPGSPNKLPQSSPLDILNLVPVVGPTLHQTAENVQKIAQHGGGIIAIPFSFSLIGTVIYLISQLVPYLSWWQIPGLLGTLLFRPRRRAWGVVYDQITKQPLDPAILELKDRNGKTYQTITDYYGRYQFLVGPGTYTLTVKKSNYVFPSALAQGKPDPIYEDRYLGQPITINDASSITWNIPMDPVQQDWNQTQKTIDPNVWQYLWPRIQKWMFIAGAVFSLVMALLASTLINLLICTGYMIALAGILIYRRQHPWGVVADAVNKPLAGSVVSISDLDHPTVKRPPVVTNETGRYNFLVEGGRYQMSVALPKGKDQFSDPIPGPTIRIPGQFGAIHQDLMVEE